MFCKSGFCFILLVVITRRRSKTFLQMSLTYLRLKEAAERLQDIFHVFCVLLNICKMRVKNTHGRTLHQTN